MFQIQRDRALSRWNVLIFMHQTIVDSRTLGFWKEKFNTLKKVSCSTFYFIVATTDCCVLNDTVCIVGNKSVKLRCTMETMVQNYAKMATRIKFQNNMLSEQIELLRQNMQCRLRANRIINVALNIFLEHLFFKCFWFDNLLNNATVTSYLVIFRTMLHFYIL